MKITCPNCASSYAVADDMLGPNGRKVKCASCSEVWLAKPEPPQVVIDAEDTRSRTMESDTDPEHMDGFDATVSSDNEWSQDGEAVIDDVNAGVSGVPHRHQPGRVKLKGESTGPSVFEVWIRRTIAIGTPTAVACGLLGLVLAIPLRESVVSIAPDLARLYATVGLDVNVRGITFAPVTAERSVVAGLSVLTIEGAMTNADSVDRQTAPIRFALLAEDGAEIFVWRMDPPTDALIPGQTVPLMGELTAPPETVAAVSVRFLQQDEVIPGQVF